MLEISEELVWHKRCLKHWIPLTAKKENKTEKA